MRCVCGFEGDGFEYLQHLVGCKGEPESKWDFYVSNQVDKNENVGPISDVLESEEDKS